MRLDAYLAETRPEYSRSAWQKLIKQGNVRVNGTCVDITKYPVEEEDNISVKLPEEPTQEAELPIVFEDDDVIVFNKPLGMLTHAKGTIAEEFTVADYMKTRTSYKADTNRPGIIHRLDRDTSGILLCVKNEAAAKMLSKQFERRTAKKTYYAVTDGIPKELKAMIDVPIGRDPKHPSQFRADPNGKSAQTYYEVESASNTNALIKLQPRTGRTHQLRVHMQYLGTPIKGDRVYGKPADRLFLHANQLQITLPSGTNHIFTAPLPPEFMV